ncbi:protein of unknown function (plasmid) [Cupriavidus taiwanensis]|uniref:Uncharacterized protein n=1 Tax=Cupriavidus taiwanensis TaxID=164546 RepID=A0A375ISB9_9BURK|nr:protein of unknown function [Cupriavidus taiwanensis]
MQTWTWKTSLNVETSLYMPEARFNTSLLIRSWATKEKGFIRFLTNRGKRPTGTAPGG